MLRRAILHIGTEKTGTTTLQHFLATNRAALAARGWVYPRFCGEKNHTGLAAYALDDARRDPIAEPFGVHCAEDVEPFRARMRAAAAAELDGAPGAIFCSEHCHSRLTDASEVARLRDFLGGFFDEVRVCVYLRRQDQVALSLYSTRLKSGAESDRLLPTPDPEDRYYNYARVLALWEEGFGAGNLHVRLFDRRALVGGDVVTDFLDLWGLGPAGDYVAVSDRNASIRPAAQEFLRHVNRHLAPIGGRPIEAVRGPLVARIEAAFEGPGARPSRAEAEAFYAAFRASNEAVRAARFPDRDRLFDEDFSAYPEEADDRGLSLDAFAEVAARIHMAAQEEICRLEAEVALREARLLWSRDQRPAAIASLRRALSWRPRHAEAHRTLGEYLLRENRVEDALVPARAAVEHRPDSVEYWHFLGMVLRRSGAIAEAIEAQERALALDPDHEAAKRERDALAGRLDGPAARSA
jgi:uncharacterized small protein (DUF1192 family)